MQYPQAEDYIRAVQQPEQAFLRPELRSAEFELHPVFRIPMPASGNAAVVFRADVDGRRHRAAVLHPGGRLHPRAVHRAGPALRRPRHRGLRSPPDLARRRDLAERRGLADGADGVGRRPDAGRVRRAPRPRRRHRRAVLARDDLARASSAGSSRPTSRTGTCSTATSWSTRTSTLRLVDFDGSWISGFQGDPPPRETGHPNYQPAGRKWGRWMDTFPGLVIYTALLDARAPSRVVDPAAERREHPVLGRGLRAAVPHGGLGDHRERAGRGGRAGRGTAEAGLRLGLGCRRAAGVAADRAVADRGASRAGGGRGAALPRGPPAEPAGAVVGAGRAGAHVDCRCRAPAADDPARRAGAGQRCRAAGLADDPAGRAGAG